MKSAAPLRIVQIGDEAPIPSFFLRFREPVEALGFSYAHVRAETLFNQRISLVGDTNFHKLPLLKGADVVVFQRAFSLHAADLFMDLKKHGVPLIYETDDLLYDLPPWSGLSLNNAQKAGITNMVAEADLVTCSTKALSERLSEFNDNVRVIENYAEYFNIVELYTKCSADPHLAIVNTDYFKLIGQKKDLFLAIDQAIRTLGYKVTFLGSMDPTMEQLSHLYPERVSLRPIFKPWHKYFLQDVASLGTNVAMVPLELHDHHRYKSDIKFFDFASLGVPGIFNNPEIYRHVLHKQNGFLCDGSRQGWLDGLAFFADAEARKRCGDSARSAALKRGVNDYARELNAAFQSVLMDR